MDAKLRTHLSKIHATATRIHQFQFMLAAKTAIQSILTIQMIYQMMLVSQVIVDKMNMEFQGLTVQKTLIALVFLIMFVIQIQKFVLTQKTLFRKIIVW